MPAQKLLRNENVPLKLLGNRIPVPPVVGVRNAVRLRFNGHIPLFVNKNEPAALDLSAKEHVPAPRHLGLKTEPNVAVAAVFHRKHNVFRALQHPRGLQLRRLDPVSVHARHHALQKDLAVFYRAFPVGRLRVLRVVKGLNQLERHSPAVPVRYLNGFRRHHTVVSILGRVGLSGLCGLCGLCGAGHHGENRHRQANRENRTKQAKHFSFHFLSSFPRGESTFSWKIHISRGESTFSWKIHFFRGESTFSRRIHIFRGESTFSRIIHIFRGESTFSRITHFFRGESTFSRRIHIFRGESTFSRKIHISREKALLNS